MGKYKSLKIWVILIGTGIITYSLVISTKNFSDSIQPILGFIFIGIYFVWFWFVAHMFDWFHAVKDAVKMWITWKYKKPIKITYLDRAIVILKGKSKIRRNLLAAIIKKSKTEYPFIPEDYSKAKKLYDEYYQMDYHIENISEIAEKMDDGDVFVTKFSHKYATKGERCAAYHIGRHGNPEDGMQTFKCVKKGLYGNNKELKWIDLAFPDGISCMVGMSDNHTSYLYATQVEIDGFLRKEGKIKDLKKKIEYHRGVENSLNKEINTIKNA